MDYAKEIRAALARGNGREALRLASKLPHLGEHKEAITRGWAACTRPDFYEELGRDPAHLINIGVAACKARFENDQS